MLVRLDEMAVRIMRADGDDRPGHVVHQVDVYAARPWPILVIIRPNIGGGPLSLSLTWREVERKASAGNNRKSEGLPSRGSRSTPIKDGCGPSHELRECHTGS